MNPDLLKEFATTAVRYFGPPLIAWMVLKLGLTNDQATAVLVGVAGFLASFAWALINKVQAQGQINTALDLPKGTSKDTLNEVIAKGHGTSATAKK